MFIGHLNCSLAAWLWVSLFPSNRSCRLVSYPGKEVESRRSPGSTLDVYKCRYYELLWEKKKKNLLFIFLLLCFFYFFFFLCFSIFFPSVKGKQKNSVTWTVQRTWVVQAALRSWVLLLGATSSRKLEKDNLAVVFYCDNCRFVILCITVCMTRKLHTNFIVYNCYYTY